MNKFSEIANNKIDVTGIDIYHTGQCMKYVSKTEISVLAIIEMMVKCQKEINALQKCMESMEKLIEGAKK